MAIRHRAQIEIIMTVYLTFICPPICCVCRWTITIMMMIMIQVNIPDKLLVWYFASKGSQAKTMTNELFATFPCKSHEPILTSCNQIGHGKPIRLEQLAFLTGNIQQSKLTAMVFQNDKLIGILQDSASEQIQCRQLEKTTKQNNWKQIKNT